MFEFKVPSTFVEDTLRSTDYSTLHSAHTVCVHTLYLNLETLDSAYSASPHWTHSLFSLVQATATHTKIYKHGSPRRIRQHGISDLLLYEDVFRPGCPPGAGRASCCVLSDLDESPECHTELDLVQPAETCPATSP